MEGNRRAHRRAAAALGVRSASDIYAQAIAAHFPDAALDTVNAADRDEALPAGAGLDAYDGLVISGSALHAGDTGFAVRNQIDLVRAFAQTGKPILGSCWGLQIAALAAGGAVRPSPRGREAGFARNIALNYAGRGHAFLAGRPAAFDAICIHYDEVTRLPAGAIVLAGNAHSPVQAAIVPLGRSEVWAVQYHPEYDLQQIASMMRHYQKDMIADGFVRDAEEVDAQVLRLEALHRAPDDKALAWQLGVDKQVLDDALRRTEIINWVRMCLDTE